MYLHVARYRYTSTNLYRRGEREMAQTNQKSPEVSAPLPHVFCYAAGRKRAMRLPAG